MGGKKGESLSREGRCSQSPTEKKRIIVLSEFSKSPKEGRRTFEWRKGR